MTAGLTALIIAIVEIILRALLPALVAGATPGSENGARQPLLRERLLESIRARRSSVSIPSIPSISSILLLLALAGCTQTIYVPSGEPVRLRETIKAARVWVLDKDGLPTAGVMDLPAGWYCLPDPGPTESK